MTDTWVDAVEGDKRSLQEILDTTVAAALLVDIGSGCKASIFTKLTDDEGTVQSSRQQYSHDFTASLRLMALVIYAGLKTGVDITEELKIARIALATSAERYITQCSKEAPLFSTNYEDLMKLAGALEYGVKKSFREQGIGGDILKTPN